MGRHGGTSSIVYYMCALQGKDLCKATRWPAEQVSHFSDNAVRVVPLRTCLIYSRILNCFSVRLVLNIGSACKPRSVFKKYIFVDQYVRRLLQIKYEQHKKQIEDSERNRREQKVKQKKKSPAPPSSTTTTPTATTTTTPSTTTTPTTASSATSTKTGEDAGEVLSALHCPHDHTTTTVVW